MSDQPTTEKLESKVWYRLGKVFYLVLVGFAALSVVGLSLSQWPREIEVFKVRCNYGVSYVQGISEEYSLVRGARNDAESWCSKESSGELNQSKVNQIIDDSVNDRIVENNKVYTIVKESKTEGSWENVFGTLAVGLAIVATAAFLIRKALLYVAIGK